MPPQPSLSQLFCPSYPYDASPSHTLPSHSQFVCPRYPYDHLPEDEFSYPEFIEATARAGYLQYWTVNGDKSIPVCFMKGIESSINTLKIVEQKDQPHKK